MGSRWVGRQFLKHHFKVQPLSISTSLSQAHEKWRHVAGFKPTPPSTSIQTQTLFELAAHSISLQLAGLRGGCPGQFKLSTRTISNCLLNEGRFNTDHLPSAYSMRAVSNSLFGALRNLFRALRNLTS